MKPEEKKKTNKKVNPKTLKKALRAIKSRFATNDINRMSEVSAEYVTGMQTALGMGYNVFVDKFHDPSLFTLRDLLNLSDMVETEIDVIIAVALKEAKEKHVRHNISHLLNEED